MSFAHTLTARAASEIPTGSPRRRAPTWRSLAASLTIVWAASLSGCGIFGKGEIDPTAKMSPREIYDQGKSGLDSGRYLDAAKLFGKLESRYPFGAWAQQAQLDAAYAYYKAADRVQALAGVERFIRLYPTSDQLDYAYYLKGLINFNEQDGLLSRLGGQDLSERDQRSAREAFEAFRQVTTRYPESRYAADSRDRMLYLVNAMAGSEVHVARYYYIRGAYVAAINRAQGVIKQYQTSPAVEEALFIAMKSYEKLGLEIQRSDAERVLRANFPQTALFSRGLNLSERSWWEIWK